MPICLSIAAPSAGAGAPGFWMMGSVPATPTPNLPQTVPQPPGGITDPLPPQIIDPIPPQIIDPPLPGQEPIGDPGNPGPASHLRLH